MFRTALNPILLITGLLISYTATASNAFVKQAQAISVLEKADQAIRDVHGLTYRADYVGAFTSRGRVATKVLLRRQEGDDEVMQSIAYSTSIEVEATDPPYAQQHYPRAYTLIETGKESRLLDPAEKTVRIAEGHDRRQLNYGALTSGILPQYLRAEPLQFEIRESIGAAYLGTTMLGMVESHVVWLKFEADSGFGEQILYFGLDDHLLRKATLVIPETRLEGEPGDAMATNPAMYVDLTMTEVQVLSVVPDSAFNTSHAGFQEIIVGRDKPSVGDAGPSWTLRLPGGGTISADDLVGNVAVLYFWASWCPSCHRYMPAVQKIHDSFPEGMQVLAINTYDRDDAMAHIRERRFTFPVALGGDELLAEGFQMIGQPAMVVLDRKGVIRHLAVAEDPANESLWALLKELAAE